ncbi:hypothetical protein [Roseovarius sp. 2305UL8-3]|uniref:hypothetical protein n=1 Tax=Roseovarius conchicola TaxID=3121636 RepID=UPI003528B480
MRFFIFLTTFLAMSLPITPVWAAFGDCTDPGYLAEFPDAASATSIDCVEHFRIVVATPSGPRQIRGISDISAGWAVPPALMTAIESGAQAAASAMPGLGGYALDDVTLLILDDVRDFDPDRRVLGVADGRGGDGGLGRAGECLVTLYGLAAATDPAEIETTTAHEIFHCLQYATLNGGQMGTYGSGGDWWIEGSAEYFAALAVEGSQPFTDRSAGFDAAVEAGTSLDQLAHDAALFFFWFGQTQGAGALTTFMASMATSGGSSAQHAAMRGALSDDQWLEFAQTYIDGEIAHPQGGSLASSPTPSETLTIDAPGIQRVELVPFAIRYAQLEYTCGTWGNRVSPGSANLSIRRENERDWQKPWPEETDVREGQPGTHRLAGMNTGSGPQTIQNDVERRRACQPCGDTDEVDMCLTGTWQMTGGGPIEWMRSQGLPLTNVRDGPRFVTFNSDGLYGAEPLDISITIRDDERVAVGEGFTTTAFGRWSAKDGTMNICQDAGGLSGKVTMTTPEGEYTQPVSQPGMGQITMAYSCSEGSMSTTMDFSGLSPMVTNYGKIAEEMPRP